MNTPIMTPEDAAWHATWRPASGHPSGRWRVVREFFTPLTPPPGQPTFQTACGANGHDRLFKTYDAALHAARVLNAADDA